MIILPQVVMAVVILNILVIAIGVPMLVLCYKRTKHTDETVQEIVQILNKMELDDIYYKLHDKPEDR